MKLKVIHIFFLLLFTINSLAQYKRVVQNRPYTDLRPLHFGVLLGTHLQDVELNNIGVQRIIQSDGNVVETLITADQDRWDMGLTVGVLAEFRLNKTFQFRLVPAMYFGNRHLTFHNFTKLNQQGVPTQLQQDTKTAYISSAFDILFAAPRINNHRPYLVAGINPMLNLNNKHEQYIALKPYEMYAEIGVGCDFYLPYFKLRPELKFMFSLKDSYDKTHAKNIKDKNMLPYTNAVNHANTKIIALTFYFE